VVISPNDPSAMERYVTECQEMKLPYLYDPSQQLARINADNMRQGVKGAESLFVNEYEFELLQKHTGLSAGQIKDHVKLIVITHGKDGASIFIDGGEYQIPVVPPNEIVDPTGVGDAFRGGFLKGYSLGMDWQTCGQMGSLAATYCLEHRGTQNHTYSIEEFVNRYRVHFDDQGALDVLLTHELI
ncbi:MAG: PfkB family carbohydrate kinase, partial [Anaerolineaceae bacterium]|nr:PfkB family carbohydrate kinase [Anaerolineaceae bacterium]